MIVSDLEGPWVKADHAFDSVSKGIPQGKALFEVLSAYDDYRFFFERAPGYEAGDTLMLVAPFLVAFGVEDSFLRTVANLPNNTKLISGARQSIRYIKETDPFYLVSTSYEQYVERIAVLLGVEKGKYFCTRFPIDSYKQDVEEKDVRLIKDWTSKIIEMPVIEAGEKGELDDLELQAKEQLDYFFWEKLPETSFAPLLDHTKPVGGKRKFTALAEALELEGKSLPEARVIGDSITDSVMLERTRKAGGLAISFNGNRYAIGNSNVAIISDTCWMTAAAMDVHQRAGIEGLREATGKWGRSLLSELRSDDLLGERVFQGLDGAIGQGIPPSLFWLPEIAMDEVIAESELFRKQVRGRAIGSLG